MTDDYAFEGCDHHRVPVSWPECPCDNPDRRQHDADMEAAVDILGKMLDLVWTEKRGRAVTVSSPRAALLRFAAITLLIRPESPIGPTYKAAAKRLRVSQWALAKHAKQIQGKLGVKFRRSYQKA